MQLSKRLQMSADYVKKGSVVADVGCDHAYMAIYLVTQQIAERVIAMDVNEGPLEKAAENIVRFGVADRIETRRSDGLEMLSPGEADTVLCAGMGGALMIRILSGGSHASQAADRWILQPQSEIAMVRRYILENGFRIEDEKMCLEDGKFYTSICAVKRKKAETAGEAAAGKETETDEEARNSLCSETGLLFGEALIRKNDPVLYEFLLREKGLNERLKEALTGNTAPAAVKRLSEVEEKLLRIEETLELYTCQEDADGAEDSGNG